MSIDINDLTELLALLAITYVFIRWRWSGAEVLLINLILIYSFKVLKWGGVFEDTHYLRINIILVLQILLYHLFYMRVLKREWMRRVALSSLISYLILWPIVYYLWQDIDKSIQFYSYVVGVFGIMLCIFMFFYEQLVVFESDVPFYRRYYVWISAGLFVWLCTEMPVMGLITYAIENPEYQFNRDIFLPKKITSAIYYLLYLIALIWAKES